MNRLLIDIRPNRNYKITVPEITTDFITELFTQSNFEFSKRINPTDATHIIMMAYVYRLTKEFWQRNLKVKVSLAPSRHPNYPSWLLLIKTDDQVGNIMPIIAKYLYWDRVENQDAMTTADLMAI